MKNKQVSDKEIIMQGIAASPGIALGNVFVFRPYPLNLSELELGIEDVEKEFLMFENAIARVIEQLEFAQNESELRYGNQFSEIFESQKAFLRDMDLVNEIKREIKDSSSSAAHGVSKILSEKSDYFINMENTYFRERAYDIIDLKQKLIRALLGIDYDYQLNSPSIVVAEMLSPSDTIQFNRNFILGFLTDQGGKTSHAAILARGLRIPSVVNGYNLSHVLHDGDSIILDGFKGTIIINPTEETKKRYHELKKEYDRFEKGLDRYIKQPSETADGEKITLLANIEFAHEVSIVQKNKAAGVGLFRTESIFIREQEEPTEETQFQIYKQAAAKIAPLPLVIRTIDLGGDKFLDSYNPENEPNPFLGWRAIRFCLDQPDVFKSQLRAILRAGVSGNVKILIPMISAVEEIIHTKAIIKEAENELTQKHIAFKKDIPLGIMIETPAAAISASMLADYVDFFSIGTNDLTQYVLAIDRTNEKVSQSYNTFNPAVLELIFRTIEAGRERNMEVALCGEFAAAPSAIPLLIGMGLRSLSMSPVYLVEAKKIIRALDIKACEQLFEEVRVLHQAQEIEQRCQKFLKANIPDLKFLI